MALRRMILQFGALAGVAAFCLTLILALQQHNLDILQASVRAIGAGVAVLFLSLIISRFIEMLGGPTE